MIRIIFFIVFFFIRILSYSQVVIQQTETDYTLKIETDSIIRHLTFWKDRQSNLYTGCKYSYTKFKKLTHPINLSDEIPMIEILWKMATDSISIQLSSFFIGYPEEYSDIYQNQINAFIRSEKWQNHIKKNGKTLDYQLLHDVMMENNVYKPWNEFLLTKGYRITAFSTEKHGFATKESLKKAGFTGQEIIPLPFMVSINLESIQE